jgi:hypothetical protein
MKRIWVSRMEYSVLKEKMKENQCGLSKTRNALLSGPRAWILKPRTGSHGGGTRAPANSGRAQDNKLLLHDQQPTRN